MHAGTYVISRYARTMRRMCRHLCPLCGERWRSLSHLRRVRREYIRTVWLWHTFADNCPDRNWPSAAARRMPGQKKNEKKTPPAGRPACRISHVTAARPRPRDGGHSIWRRSFTDLVVATLAIHQSQEKSTSGRRRGAQTAEINSYASAVASNETVKPALNMKISLQP